jgi:hypothetical protein
LSRTICKIKSVPGWTGDMDSGNRSDFVSG